MMDAPRSLDPVSPDLIELVLATSSARPYIRLREYTDQQIEQFEHADILDGDALRIARQFDLATGGSFFQDRESDDALDRP